MLNILRTIFLFVFVLVINLHISFAENSNVSVTKKIYQPNEEIIVHLNLNECASELKWMIMSANNTIYIFDSKSSSWHQSLTNWNDVKYFNDEIKLKISNVDDKKIPLIFKIQNTRLGIVTEYPPMYIWISSAYSNYINDLNKAILPL